MDEIIRLQQILMEINDDKNLPKLASPRKLHIVQFEIARLRSH